MSSIVWLASYPKSGNTWLRAFIQNYRDASDQPSDINAMDKYFADEYKPAKGLRISGGPDSAASRSA